MMENKLFVVGLSLRTPQGLHVVTIGHRIAPDAAIAAALVTATHYQQSATKDELLAVTTAELPKHLIAETLKALEQNQPPPPAPVVHLVEPSSLSPASARPSTEEPALKSSYSPLINQWQPPPDLPEPAA